MKLTSKLLCIVCLAVVALGCGSGKDIAKATPTGRLNPAMSSQQKAAVMLHKQRTEDTP